jgi:hypothetical protein
LTLEWLEQRDLLSAAALNLGIAPAPASITYGSLDTAGEVDSFSFTISAATGAGSLAVGLLGTSGSLMPRLTLSGPAEQLLIQSDSGRIVQHLLPGDYSVSVSAQAGLGEYQLTARFTNAEAPLTPLRVGTLPRTVAVGDFNGDGQADVLASNLLDASVSLMLGNGDATFQAQRVISAAGRPSGLAARDVNEDDQLDVVVTSRDSNAVVVLLGQGDGTFQPPMLFATGSLPSGFALADLDGDGHLDLAVANYGSNSVSVLLGNGDGTFQAEQSFATGRGPVEVAVAEINGDGRPDLVVANSTGNTLSILLGQGDGSFLAGATLPTGLAPLVSGVADLNGDGLSDIVVVNYGDSTVGVMLGNGDGSFQDSQAFDAKAGAYSMTLADVNGDGIVDVAAVSFSNNTVNVLLGMGDGTLSEPRFFSAGRGAGAIAVADVDGDGRPDALTADLTDNAVSVLLGRGDGTFAIRSTPPRVPDLRVYSTATADLNGDGRPDLVTANKGDSNVAVLLLNADGSFQTRQTFPTGPNPSAAVIADINGDGIRDIITGSYTEASVSVLLGRGDGTFDSPRHFNAGGMTYYQLTVADVNGDGRPDIVTANINSTASVLLNATTDPAETTFEEPRLFSTGTPAPALTVTDVTGDGLADLVVANRRLGLLRGNGDGTFEAIEDLDVAGSTFWVLVDDLNDDGLADIVSTNSGTNNISVLLGLGGGAFQPRQDFATGTFSGPSVLADVSGDGIADLITARIRTGTGSVLLGRADGTFEDFRVVPLGTDNSGVVVADFNGDGLPDLAQGNFQNDSVTIAHGQGDGTFDPPQVVKLRKNRYSVAIADVNGDGKLDAIQSHLRQDSLTVQLGTGTGSFEPGAVLDVGSQPTSVRVADFNRDGRVDLVTTNSDRDSVSVLLGNGDGTFNEQQAFAVGRSPRTVAVADVDGDGALDLAVANYNDGSVSVLLGNGDGSFGDPQTFAVGERPYSLTMADVDGDGNFDVLAANSADNTVSVLLGKSDGTFQQDRAFTTGQQPFDVIVADVNADGIPDVLTANNFADSVSVLLGRGDGSFLAAANFATGSHPSSVTAVDLDGDDVLDLVTANFGEDSTSVLLGNGDGTFQSRQTVAANLLPTLTVAADLNGDGRPDLVSVGNHNNTIHVQLNGGRGKFQPATAATDVSLRDTPFLADINGDGRLDRVILNRAGEILFRAGLSSATFAPPIVLNLDRPARDITILRRGPETLIAAADARFDSELSATEFVFTVSLYGVSSDGAIDRQAAFSTTALPSRLVAQDVTGDGLADLVAANPLDNSVTIAIRNADGAFAAPLNVAVGNAPSDIACADVNLDGRLDVLVSNQASGDVSVLLNDAEHLFATTLRFRAGTQPNGLDDSSDVALVRSLAESVSLVAGEFTGDEFNDVIVVNRGAHSFTVLAGNGRGGFENPRVSLATSTSDGLDINERPGEIVSGDFNRDGALDVAVLMEDTGQLWIFSGAGDGTFERSFTVSVGDQATGLSVAPGVGSGLLDLLVGNGFGDVLHLEGKGDGTFQIRGNRVSLSVVPDLFGPGQAGVLVGNQQDNRVTVQTQTSGGSGFSTVEELGADNAAQLAPGDVQWALLARDGTIPDAVVVSTGGNAVIVYHTTAITNGVPVFAPDPQTIFVGTAPASLTVADINDDDVPDMLVANPGSNNVSVIFGSYDGDGIWMGTPGLRLKSGGDGPIAVAVRDLNGDAVLDLAVTNGSSGTVTSLFGVGQGFFDDQQPAELFDLGGAVDQPPTFAGDSDIGFAVTTAGEVVRFDLSNAAAGAHVVFEADPVVAARALPNGQLVVAIADGRVQVLRPQSGVFVVAAELQAQSGTLVSPSSLVVLQQPSGQFQVLVSNHGSDAVSVFSASVVTLPPVFILPTASNSATSTTVFAFFSPSTSTVTTSVLSTVVGLSLSGFTSQTDLAFSSTSIAALVAVEGNSYSTVAVLDFGSQQDDTSGDGRGRMPWLSTRFPIGDVSPLARFVIGMKEAIDQYRGESKSLRDAEDSDTPRNDPWNVDLFHRPGTRPKRVRKSEPPTTAPEQRSGADPGKANEQSLLDSFWIRFPQDPSEEVVPKAPRSAARRFSLGLSALVVAGVLLARKPQVDSEYDGRHWESRQTR